MRRLPEDILNLYAEAPLHDRLHIALRLKTFKPEELEALIPKKGNILDFGCGHGFISAYLAVCSPERTILGLDIDERKLEIANNNPGRALGNVNFQFFSGKFPELQFDAIIALDVLYLMTQAAQEAFVTYAYTHLTPKGTLLIKETRKSQSWKFFWAFAEEKLATFIGLTRGNKRFFYRGKSEWAAALTKAGFGVEIYSPQTKLPDYDIFLCKKQTSCL